jgi:hypothetical protein
MANTQARVEVKIGVQFASRELTIETGKSADDIEQTLRAALSDDDGVLVLVDDKGRRVLVPTEKLAYVEVGEAETRRVGFGTI